MSTYSNVTMLVLLTALSLLLSVSHLHAQRTDSELLQTFCDVRDIKGRDCRNAKNYKSGRVCNVELSDSRYEGAFFAPSIKSLVVGYSSDCEPHATNWGGALIFEAAQGGYLFRGYLPGYSPSRCVILSKPDERDRLFCLTGYLGQGHLETGLAEYIFKRDFSGKPSISIDVFMSATSSVGAYGAEKIRCDEPQVRFAIDNLSVGPTQDTVAVEIEYLSRKSIVGVCAAKHKPESAVVELERNEAFVDPKAIQKDVFVFDLKTREAISLVAFRLKQQAILSRQSASPPAASGVDRLNPNVLGRRVALLIGNSQYKSVPSLDNPIKDVDAIARTLGKLGFAHVAVVKDATKAETLSALAAFSDRAANADWAVVYYAGHGIEVGGQNFLVPIEATLKRDQHVRLEAISLDDVLETTASATKVRLVILDACRDNPFLPRMSRSFSTRSVSRGLANIEPQKGVLVAYAAKHGQLAEDGEEYNSPFASALLKHISEPGLDIGLLFRKVRDSVLTMTRNRQEPFVYGSLPGHTLSFVPTK